MGLIYQEAVTLLIWLGHGVDKLEDQKAARAFFLAKDPAEEEAGPDSGYEPFETEHQATDATEDKASKLENAALQCSTIDFDNFPGMSRMQALAFALALKLADRYNPVEKDPGYNDGGLPNNCANWLWPRLARYALAGLSESEVTWHLTESEDASRLLKRSKVTMHLLEALDRQRVSYLSGELLEMYKGYMKLCSRRYFFRRWVLQEILQSRPEDIYICWGNYEKRLDEFLDHHRLMHTLLYESYDRNFYKGSWIDVNVEGINARDSQRSFNILGIRDLFSMEVTIPPILNMLYTYCDTFCADDRDLVYAFLGIGGERTSLSPDYSLSAEQVFVALASSLIRDGGVDDVLSAAAMQYDHGYRERHSSTPQSLPSWVVDLKAGMPGTFRMLDVPKVDPPDAQVIDHGNHLTFVAKIGKVDTPFESEGGEIPQGLYLCQMGKYTAINNYLIFRLLSGEEDCFVLTGSVFMNPGSDDLWGNCSEISTRTVRLF